MVAGFKIADNTVLIMDEVDGMSGGDRGGIGALNALIKKTRVSAAVHTQRHLPNCIPSDPHYLHRQRSTLTKDQASNQYLLQYELY